MAQYRHHVWMALAELQPTKTHDESEWLEREQTRNQGCYSSPAMLQACSTGSELWRPKA